MAESEQQLMFQAVCDLFGWEMSTLTPTARTRIGKVAKELRAAGATTEMVAWSPKAWDRMWGDDVPTLTDTALAAHWPEIAKRWNRHERAIRTERARAALETIDTEPLPVDENRRRWRAMIAAAGKRSYGEILRDVMGR
jgi:hypothetical protein